MKFVILGVGIRMLFYKLPFKYPLEKRSPRIFYRRRACSLGIYRKLFSISPLGVRTMAVNDDDDDDESVNENEDDNDDVEYYACTRESFPRKPGILCIVILIYEDTPSIFFPFHP